MACCATKLCDGRMMLRSSPAGARMKHIALAMMLTIIAVPALAQQTPGVVTSVATCSAPAPTTLDDGWLTDRPENVGLDGARLCGIADRMTAANANVHAVVVARRGKLVYEHYSSGYDEPWGGLESHYDFSAATKHDMRSISKSVTSLLVGIAIDRKLIAGIDDPVVNFFPEHAAVRPAGWGGITIRHLLTMSSGMAWDENLPWTDPRNDEPPLGTQADPIRYVLSKPIAAPPGTVWNYNGGGTDVLGSIIERVSGKPFDAFAREVLFEPLGITDWEWKRYRNGKIAPAAGLRLRPRDAAKIGQLVLSRGNWKGQQIVSASWNADSITPRHQA